MFRIHYIVQENNATFYDYRSNKKIDIIWRVTGEVLVAAILAFSTPSVFDNFLLGAITAQSILAGFSFNVMFFLANNLSTSSNPVATGPAISIEASLRSEKLDKLGKELFHNLSYFNLFALACVAFSLILLAPIPVLSFEWTHLHAIKIVYNYIFATGSFLMRDFFYMTAIESAYTFARVVGRVSYLFEQRLQ